VYVSNLIKELFETKTSIYKSKKSNTIHLRTSGIKFVRFMKEIGLSSGYKIRNKQGMPNWILENKEYTRAYIRGLIDTDGCVYRVGNGTIFSRINFDSYNPKLREDFRKALLMLGFNPMKWMRNKTTAIHRKDEVFKYMKEIGFSNPKHQRRFEKFNKAPVV